MISRGLFGAAGIMSDYRAFRRQGMGFFEACGAAFDYWRWDCQNWMAWDGKPRDLAFRKWFR
jgi:hypothetical protein